MDAHALIPSEPPVDPRLGQVVNDRYKILRKLGEGGMGTVYEGEHVLIKRRVAIKALHPEHARNPEVVARFHREALAATSVGNEHIIEVTDMGRFPDGAIYLVLEYLDGRDLSALLDAEGPMKLGRVVHIASQVCEALSAAHAKGIVHRDLKPENVFLIKRGDDPEFAKVLDFGISKIKDTADGVSSSMTRTGTAMGTPYYMAPEQVEGRKDVDHRVDIYALGVMLFRMLTNQHPFDEQTFPMLVLRICTSPPPPVRGFRPDVPVEVENVIARMLAKDKAERFNDCLEVRAALRPFLTVDATPVLASPPGSGVPGALTPVLGSDVPPISAIRPVATAAAVVPANAPPAAQGTIVTERAPSSRGIVFAVIALGVVAIGIALAAALGLFHGPAPTASRDLAEHAAPTLPPSGNATVVAPTVAAPSTVAQAVVAPTAPVARDIRVRITTNPDTAELLLDGNHIANPFDAELPETTTPRRLEARAPGYTTLVQDLVLQFPQTVAMRLRRGHGVDDQRRAPAAHVTPTEQHATVVAAPGSTGTEPAHPVPVAEHPVAPAHATTTSPSTPTASPASPTGVVVPPAATPLHHANF